MRPAAIVSSPPVHGYRGEPIEPSLDRPQGFTLAVSRESGSRGGSIARKVGELLSWQVFDQETLEYLIQNDTARDQFLSEIPGPAMSWANNHFSRLLREQQLTAESETASMIRLLLAVAARGEVVIIGRGAGYLLPTETTLHTRVVAFWEDRVAYFAQWLRLDHDEAAAEVRSRDERRAHFVASILGRNAAEVTGYDLIVNAGRLGIETAAQLIAWAVRTKKQALELREADPQSSLPYPLES